MTCIVVGGSSGLGLALAEQYASEGYSLVLVSSDERDISSIASDLTLRHEVKVATVSLDLGLPNPSFSGIDTALEQMPVLTSLLFPIGASIEDDRPGQSRDTLDVVTRVNYLSVCALIAQYLPRLKQAEQGVITGFGSIAAARGRTKNAAYAASKRALDSYFESLRHSLTDTKVIAQFYVLGYLDTNLAFGHDTPLRPASPVKLAKYVFDHRHVDFGRRFYPGRWRLLSGALKMVPWPIYRRISF